MIVENTRDCGKVEKETPPSTFVLPFVAKNKNILALSNNLQSSVIVSLQEEGSVVLSCYVTGGEVGCGKETFVFLRIFLIGVSSVVLVSATLDDCSSTKDSSIPLAPFGTKALYLVSDIL